MGKSFKWDAKSGQPVEVEDSVMNTPDEPVYVWDAAEGKPVVKKKEQVLSGIAGVEVGSGKRLEDYPEYPFLSPLGRPIKTRSLPIGHRVGVDVLPLNERFAPNKERYDAIANSGAEALASQYDAVAEDQFNNLFNNPFQYEQSREGKAGRYVKNFKEGTISASDLKYLANVAPNAAKELIKSVLPDTPDDQLTTDATIAAAAKAAYEANVQTHKNSKSKVQQDRDKLITDIISSSDYNIDTKKLQDTDYVDDLLEDIKSNETQELTALDREYPKVVPVPVVGGELGFYSEGTLERKNEEEYNKRYNDIKQKYAGFRGLLGQKAVNDAAKINKTEDIRIIGESGFKIARPDEYKTWLASGKTAQNITWQIEKMGIDALYATGDAGAVNLAYGDEQVIDDRNPEVLSAEIRHRLGVELEKDNNWFLNTEPSIARLDKAAEQLDEKRKAHYYKYIRPDEARRFHTQIPRRGIINELMEGAGGTLESIYNLGARAGGLRGEEDIAKDALDRVLETRLAPVGEFAPAVARLEQLNEKQKEEDLTPEELREKYDLETFTNTRSGTQKVIDGSFNLAGQVLVQAMLTRGLGNVALRGISSLGPAFNGIPVAAINFANSAKTIETIAGGAVAFASSFDQAEQDAQLLMPGEENRVKRGIFATTVGLLNGATEHIFRDSKIFDAFNREIAPSVRVLVDKLADGQIKKIALAGEFKKLLLQSPTFVQNVVKENLKESAEEVATSVGQSAAIGILAPSKFNFNNEFNNAVSTFTSMFSDGFLVAGIAGVNGTRAANIGARTLASLGVDKKMTDAALNYIDTQLAAGAITDDVANSKKAIINTAAQINTQVMPKVFKHNPDMTEKEYAKYSVQLLNEKILAQQNETSGDNVDVKANEKAIAESESIREKILGKELFIGKDFSVKTAQQINQEQRENINRFIPNLKIETDATIKSNEVQKTEIATGLQPEGTGVNVSQEDGQVRAEVLTGEGVTAGAMAVTPSISQPQPKSFKIGITNAVTTGQVEALKDKLPAEQVESLQRVSDKLTQARKLESEKNFEGANQLYKEILDEAEPVLKSLFADIPEVKVNIAQSKGNYFGETEPTFEFDIEDSGENTDEIVRRLADVTDNVFHQDAVHVSQVLPDVPEGVKFGEQQADLSVYEPNLEITFDDQLDPDELGEIEKAIQDAGLAGSTRFSNGKGLFLYNISNFKNYEEFLNEAKQVLEQLHSRGIRFKVERNARKLWNVGKTEGKGFVSYRQAQNLSSAASSQKEVTPDNTSSESTASSTEQTGGTPVLTPEQQEAQEEAERQRQIERLRAGKKAEKPPKEKREKKEGVVESIEIDLNNVDEVDTQGEDLRSKLIQDAVKVVKALEKIHPDLTVVVHDTPESFDEATNTGEQTRGAFDPKTNTIHVNVAAIEKAIGTSMYATDNTAIHEGVHPILNILAEGNPEAILDMYEQLGNLSEDLDGAYIALAHGESSRNSAINRGVTDEAELEAIERMEAVVEFISMVANGDIDLSEFDNKESKSILDKIKKLFSDFVKFLNGTTKDLDTSSVITLAQQISEAFAGERVIRRENVSRIRSIDDPTALSGDTLTTNVVPDEMEESSAMQEHSALIVSQPPDKRVNLGRDFMPAHIRRGVLSALRGKFLTTTMSDRAVTGGLKYRKGKRYSKQGGIFYPLLMQSLGVNRVWASMAKHNMRRLINSLRPDKDGYAYIGIMAMGDDSHMSNIDSFNFVFDVIEHEMANGIVRPTKRQLIDAINQAYNRKFKKGVTIGETVHKPRLSEDMTVREIKDKVLKSLGTGKAAFHKRRPFLESLLGAAEKKESRLPGIPNYPSMSLMTAEPALSTSNNGDVVAYMKVKVADLEIIETKEGDPGHHNSYPFAIESSSPVEYTLLNKGVHVSQVYPKFVNKSGNIISFEKAKKKRGEKAALRTHTRNVMLSTPTGEVQLQVSSEEDFGLPQKEYNKSLDNLADYIGNRVSPVDAITKEVARLRDAYPNFDEERYTVHIVNMIRGREETKGEEDAYNGLTPEEAENYDKAFMGEAERSKIGLRVEQVKPKITGERSQFSGAETFAQAGYGQRGRRPEGERTTVSNIVQAYLDFIAQLNQEFGGNAVKVLMDHLQYNKNKNKSAKNIDIEDIATANNFELINVLFAYIKNTPLSELGMTPFQANEYARYLKNASFAVGRKIGQSLNTAKLRRVTQSVMFDQVIDGFLDSKDTSFLDEADQAIEQLIDGDFGEGEGISDETLLASEPLQTEREIEAMERQSRALEKAMQLEEQKKQLKEIRREKSRSIASKIKLVDKKIKDTINDIIKTCN